MYARMYDKYGKTTWGHYTKLLVNIQRSINSRVAYPRGEWRPSALIRASS